MVVLGSHGKSGEIYGSDAKPVSLKWIEKQFDGTRCPGMENKPKMFFYQACRHGIKSLIAILILRNYFVFIYYYIVKT